MFQWSSGGLGVRNESLGVSGGQGTQITASGTANNKGSYHTAVTTGFAYEWLIVGFTENSAAADYVVDIAIGSAGNEWILAADLRFAAARRAASEGYQYYGLPLHVPAGASLTARCACSTASGTMRVNYKGFSRGIGGAPGFSRAIALYSPSSSRGVAVDPGGTANTKARTQIIAASAQRVVAVFGSVGFNNDVSRAASADSLLDIETGAASSERVLAGNIPMSWNTVGDGPLTHSIPLIPCDVNAGERFSANFQSSTTTAGDRTIDLALWGLVP